MTASQPPFTRRDFLTAALGTLAAGCSARLSPGLGNSQTDTVRHLIILYTNDEHGWMEPYRETSGAAGIAHLWRQREGLSPNGPFLVLSGGDMWTGPALSTALEGESMAEVMNAMGYQAAAIGNHDFDFGLGSLRARRDQSNFPFLSANIRERASGEIPDFAKPTLVLDVNGVKVGLIGLTTTETRVDTKPEAVADLEFLAYKDVVPTFAAQAREAGAELLVLLTHLCAGETRALAPLAAEHGVSLITGGHCHEEIDETVAGVRLVESGFFMRGYMRIEMLFDTLAGQVVELQTDLVRNDGRRADAEIERLRDSWRERSEPGLWEVIGYSDSQIDRKSPEMAALLLQPWLDAWPSAQVALASPRYVQQDLNPGEIKVASIWGLLSTENDLVEIALTGEQLVETINTHQPLVAGMLPDSTDSFSDGSPLVPGETYRVLVPEALYAGGNYYEFFRFDPEPRLTGIDWRTPAIDWIRTIGSSRSDPIGAYLRVSE